MNTKEVQQSVCRSEVLKGNIPCENVSFFFVGEADVLSLNKTGYLHEFESKISRADFKADLSKRKWQYFESRLAQHIPNYFSYVCPSGLILPDEVPIFSGLFYVEGDDLDMVKRPVLLHKEKAIKERVLTKFSRVLTERMYLGSCRLTYNNKKHKEWVSEKYPEL